jgi:hypothetical protein
MITVFRWRISAINEAAVWLHTKILPQGFDG